MQCSIPQEVLHIAEALRAQEFQAFLVGGCVRDLSLGREPKDWDITTDAKPEEVLNLFPDSVYENDFGTVLVKVKSDVSNAGSDETDDPFSMSHSPIRTVEVTTFRLEGKYSDKRHPDEVKFAKTVEEDLSRRDFTVNAMALEATSDMRQGGRDSIDHVATPMSLVDPFGGQDDLKQGIIRTVGDPNARFTEDALRLMRAVRFATELSSAGGSASGGDFTIDLATRRAIEKHAGLLEMIAKERIRDEFAKMLMTPRAAAGVILLEELDLLRYVLPELREGLGVGQNKHHVFTVFEHNVKALDYAAKQGYSLLVRTASLLHDVGKPKTKQGDGPDSTFYNHERVGAKMAAQALERLHFSNEFIAEVSHLVRHHMFYYNVGEVSPAGVRRFLVRVGPEYVDDLVKVREADRIGSGVPKAVPYKLRHFLFMIEKVKHDPISPKMLKVNGADVMKLLDTPPGPKVGRILSVLLEDVLDDPARNERGYLEGRIEELGRLPEEKLKAFADKAKETKGEAEEEVEKGMKKRYYVQ